MGKVARQMVEEAGVDVAVLLEKLGRLQHELRQLRFVDPRRGAAARPNRQHEQDGEREPHSSYRCFQKYHEIAPRIGHGTTRAKIRIAEFQAVDCTRVGYCA